MTTQKSCGRNFVRSLLVYDKPLPHGECSPPNSLSMKKNQLISAPDNVSSYPLSEPASMQNFPKVKSIIFSVFLMPFTITMFSPAVNRSQPSETENRSDFLPQQRCRCSEGGSQKQHRPNAEGTSDERTGTHDLGEFENRFGDRIEFAFLG